MKNGFFSTKRVNLSLLCGLICAVLLSQASFNTSCDDLRDNILRLHIIANSDSAFDQELKLRVRDKILDNSTEIFSGVGNIDDAIKAAEASIGELEMLAQSELFSSGADYGAEATVTDSYFETREYEDFTLPAGTYKSVLVSLGDGKGKNWWCVIFPEVCLPAASASSLNDTVDDRSAEIAYDKKHYIMRFKIAELYEELKNRKLSK